MPYLSEEIIYNLRNSLLHQSTPNIEKSTIHESRCRVDKFELVITGEDGTNGDLSEVAYDKDMVVAEWFLLSIAACSCRFASASLDAYWFSFNIRSAVPIVTLIFTFFFWLE